jgi:hypothetical protein
MTSLPDRPLAILLVAALLVATGVGARHLGAPARDARVLVGANPDLSVVYARLSVANTGLLDDQLVTRLAVLPPDGSPTEHRAVRVDGTSGPAGVWGGADRLEATADGWELRVGGEGLNARLAVRAPRAPTETCPPAVGALGGVVQDPAEGHLFDGHGFVTRTRAVGGWFSMPPGDALYVVGPGFAAAVDPLDADCPAWVRAGDRAWAGVAPRWYAERGASFTIGDWTLRVRGLGEPLALDAHAHAFAPERWAAALIGFPSPRPVLRRAVVVVEGPSASGARAALVLSRAGT